MAVELEHRLTTIEDRTKSNTRRIDELEKRQDNLDDLVTSVKVLATREENVEKDIKEIKTDVKNLSEKPGKRWDAVVDKVIMLVIGGVITYILTRIGL